MPSADYLLLETPASTVWYVPQVGETAIKRIARAPDAFLRSAAALPLKISRETLVLRTELSIDGQTLPVVVKNYRPSTQFKRLAALFRPSKAEQNWAKAELLRSRGIATPRPVIACQPRGWSGGGFLASEWIAGGENLHLYLWRIAAEPVAARLRLAAACAEQLGRLLGRMHAAGAAHRDLKAANLLIVKEPAGLQAWLVDLDGLSIHNIPIDRARKARDLARLAVGLAAHPWITGSICLHFLRAYARELPPGSVDWKPLWRDIAALAAENIGRKQQRGEQLL